MKKLEKSRYRNIYKNYYIKHFNRYHPISSYKKEVFKQYCYFKTYLLKHPIISGLSKNTPVLDIACGMGQNLLALKKEGFTNLTGLDISNDQLSFLKKNKDIKIINSSVFDYVKNNKEKYGLILMFDFIEHLRRDEAIGLLKAINKSLLKNKGVLIIQTSSASYVYNFYVRYRDLTHETFYTSDSLMDLLLLSNFKYNDFIYTNSLNYWHPNFFVKLFKGLFFRFISLIGETFHKTLALSQGVYIKDFKPNVISISKKI